MRVLHIIKATKISGAERHLLFLLTALRERDVDAHLLIIVNRGNPMDHYVAEAQARHIPVERVVIYHHLDLFVIGRIFGHIRRVHPDIVHTHLIHADTFGLIAAKLKGIPVITSRHNDDAMRRHPVLRGLNRLLWRGAQRGIVISSAVQAFMREVEDAPPEKIRLVRYGIEYEKLAPTTSLQARNALRDELQLGDETVVVGMACRLTEQKGVIYALHALAHLKQPHIHLVIAGDGPLRSKLEAETQRLGISRQVHFLGWRDDMQAIMAGYDIFLVPSLWEGFGLVLLEAMSKRLPIVASRVSAIPEVVADGETGLLVPPQDPVALAQALRTLIEDRELRAHFGLVGEDRLETHFSAGRMADETLGVYEELDTAPRATSK